MADLKIHPNQRDYTGLRSGTIVVKNPIGVQSPGHVVWLCQCDCGKQIIITAPKIEQQKIKHRCAAPPNPPKTPKLPKSPKPKRPRHGHRGSGACKSPTYRSWASMHTRCTNPKCVGYPAYGGAGITICERWEKFPNFLADMGERPNGMTLDRFPDPAGNYEPENCRWATPLQQSRNTKKNAGRIPKQLFLNF